MRATIRHRRSHLGVSVLGASLILASCTSGSTGSGSPSATAAPPASAGPATSANPSPTSPDAPASITFRFSGSEPVVTRRLVGLDELYVNPGAIIEIDGRLHMFANVFSSWPGHVDVPHLVSQDGLTWSPAAKEPVLSSDAVPFTGGGADVSTGFVAPDGTWVLILETVESTVPWKLGRATAPGPDGPWQVDPEPILLPGPAGSWDAGGLSWPSVIATATGFAMYYTGLDRPGGMGAIGLATSPDGKTWTKRDGPVLVAEAPWELGKLDRPRVAVTRRGLAMVYAGGRLTDRGLAWSDDGVTWRRDGDEPVISADRFPIDGKAWDAALLDHDGELRYYLEIGAPSGTAGTNVFLATAQLP